MVPIFVLHSCVKNGAGLDIFKVTEVPEQIVVVVGVTLKGGAGFI